MPLKSGHQIILPPARSGGIFLFPGSGSRDFRDVCGLWTVFALHDLKLYPITLFQALVATGGNGTVVNEDIGTAFSSDESISFRIIKPLDGTVQPFHILEVSRKKTLQADDLQFAEPEQFFPRHCSRCTVRLSPGKVNGTACDMERGPKRLIQDLRLARIHTFWRLR